MYFFPSSCNILFSVFLYIQYMCVRVRVRVRVCVCVCVCVCQNEKHHIRPISCGIEQSPKRQACTHTHTHTHTHTRTRTHTHTHAHAHAHAHARARAHTQHVVSPTAMSAFLNILTQITM